MFYNLKTQQLSYENVYYEPTEQQGLFNTHLLNAQDDESLRNLGFARVEENEIPTIDEKKQNLVTNKTYDEAKNVYFITHEAVNKSLDELKELKIEEFNLKRDEILDAGFSFEGKTYQSTQTDQLRINGAVTNALLAGDALTQIEWIALDNSVTNFTKAKFIEFAAAMAYFVQATIFKALELKQRVKNASDEAALAQIEWENV